MRQAVPRVGVWVLAILLISFWPGLLSPGVAWAQEEPPEQPAEGTEEEDVVHAGVVETMTVTAQKREEDPQEVPVALSTLDQEQLDVLTSSGVDVRALSGRVPSLILESSFGRAFPRFYVRGLGNTDFDLNASQPVSMVYDEVVLENPVLKGMPVWDMERVEVLRGPQGTLFGRNTPAGIVKFDSVKPSQTADGFVRASYGTFDTMDLKGAWGGPLTDTVSARFSGMFGRRDDWVENRAPGGGDDLEGYTNWAGRVQFLFEPNDRFDALVNVHAWDVDGTARVFRANMIKPGDDDVVSGFDPEVVFHDGRNEQDISAEGASLRLNYDLGPATLTSITAYDTLEMFSRGDIDGGFGAVFAPPSGPGVILFPAESADGLPDFDQLTQEVRLASNGDGPLGWLAGLYYFDESLQADTFSFATFAGGIQEGYSFQKQDNQSWALFGSLSYQLTDRWKLQGGLRYTNDEKDFSAERPDPTFQTPTLGPIVVNTDVDMTSWDLSAIYAVSDSVNVFGRVATAFRAPSIQGRILFCPDFEFGANPQTNCVSVADEEEALSTEIGFKSELLDRRLRLNLTGFRYTVDGQQIVSVGGLFNVATLLNADETEGYGFEADIQVAPSNAWLITLGISNNNTEIKDPGLEVTACAVCTVEDPVVRVLDSGARIVSVDGNSLPHAPEWIFSGIVDFRTVIGTNVLAASVDLAWHDEKRFFLYESAEYQDDSLELGARLGYFFADARYEVAVFCRNLTDEVVVQGGIDFNNLTGMVNEPRTVGIELGAHF